MAAPTDALISILRFKELTAEYLGRGLDAYAAGAQVFTAGERAVVDQIRKQEVAQVAELRRVLGSAAPAAADPAAFDYTAGDGTPFSGALGAEGGTPYTGAQKREFFKLAQLFGDFGVRFVKSQLPALAADRAALEVAVGIHGTQGRHAAALRNMRSGTGGTPLSESSTGYTSLIAPWVGLTGGRIFDTGYTGAAANESTQAGIATLVYGEAGTATVPSDSEGNQVQEGIGSLRADAFDEPIGADSARTFLARFGVNIA
jgi:hypothetical protein